jgi:hypothetical protein
MPTKVMVGARAKVYVDNVLVGIFENCNYNSNIGVEAIHLLGRFSPDEITPTSYEAVTLSCSGFRVVKSGVHVLPKFPKLQDLLALEAVTITVVDRQTKETILTAIGCVGTSMNGNHNARATSRVTVNYTGLRLSDEAGAQDEGDAVSLP